MANSNERAEIKSTETTEVKKRNVGAKKPLVLVVNEGAEENQKNASAQDQEAAKKAARQKQEKDDEERILALQEARISLLKMIGIAIGGHADPATEMQIDRVAEVMVEQDPTIEQLAHVAATFQHDDNDTKRDAEIKEMLLEKVVEKAEKNAITKEQLDAEVVRQQQEAQAAAQTDDTQAEESTVIEWPIQQQEEQQAATRDEQLMQEVVGELTQETTAPQEVQVAPSPEPEAGEESVNVVSKDVAVEVIRERIEAIAEHPVTAEDAADRLASVAGLLSDEEQRENADGLVKRLRGENSLTSIGNLQSESLARMLVEDFTPTKPVAELTGPEQEMYETAQAVIIQALVVDKGEAVENVVQYVATEGEAIPQQRFVRTPEAVIKSRLDLEMQEALGKDENEEKDVRNRKVAEFLGIDRNRIDKALLDALDKAVDQAHREGLGEIGDDGTLAGIGNYTREQISKKFRILISPVAQVLEAARTDGDIHTGEENEENASREKAVRLEAIGKIRQLVEKGIVGTALLERAPATPPRFERENEEIRRTNIGHTFVSSKLDIYSPYVNEEDLYDADGRKLETPLGSAQVAAIMIDRLEQNPEFVQKVEEGKVLEERLNSYQLEKIIRETGGRPKQSTAADEATRNAENARFAHEYNNLLLLNIDHLGKYVKLLGLFQKHGSDVVSREQIDRYEEQYKRIRSTTDSNEQRRLVQELAEKVKTHYKTAEKLGGSEKIECFEDVVELIYESERDKFGKGGEFALINEDGSVNEAHFVAWWRERGLYFDELSPDTSVNFEQDIFIPLLYRTLTLREILNTPKYFRRRTKGYASMIGTAYITNAAGQREAVNVMEYVKRGGTIAALKEMADVKFDLTHIGEDNIYVHDDRLEKLREALVYEVWFMTFFHDNDAGYRLANGSLETLKEFLQKAYWFNTLTATENRLGRIMKMAGIDDADAMEDMFTKDAPEWTVPGKVGRVFRRVLTAYRFLNDEVQLREILNSNIVEDVLDANGRKIGERKRQGMDAFFKTAIDSVFEKQFKRFKGGLTAAEQGKINSIFDVKTPELRSQLLSYLRSETGMNIEGAELARLIASDGNDLRRFALRAMHFRFERNSNGINWSDFVDGPAKGKIDINKKGFGVFNFALSQQVDPDRQNATRQAIKAAVQVVEGLQLDRNQKHSFERDMLDLRYGESLAFHGISWLGITAYLDDGATAHDKWGNLQETFEYRLGQDTKASGGAQYTMAGLKRLNLQPLQMLKVRTGDQPAYDRTLEEMLMGLSPRNAVAPGDATRKVADRNRALDVNIDYDQRWKQAYDRRKAWEWWNENKQKQNADGTPIQEPVKNRNLRLQYIEHNLDGGVETAENKRLRERYEDYMQNINFRFEKDAMRAYVSNHFDHGKQFFEWLLNNPQGLDLLHYMKPNDKTRILEFDRQKLDELVRLKLFKNWRYIWDNNNMLVNHKTRTWEWQLKRDRRGRLIKDHHGHPVREKVYITDTLARTTLGEEILEMGGYTQENDMDPKGNEHREAANVLAYMLKQWIKHRREFNTGESRIGADEIAWIRNYVTHIFPGGNAVILNDEGYEQVETTRGVFTEKFFEKKIAGPVGAGRIQLRFEAMIGNQIEGTFLGFFAMLREFIKQLGK